MSIKSLRGIVDYDPAELVLTARTATPMAEIEVTCGLAIRAGRSALM